MSVRVWQELDLHRRGALGNQVVLQVLVWLGRKTASLLALGPLFIATTEATPPPFWSSNFSTLLQSQGTCRSLILSSLAVFGFWTA